MKKTTRALAWMLCVLWALTLFPMRAAAQEELNVTKEVTLTINFSHEGTPVPDVQFKLYRVADTDRFTNLTVTPQFSVYPMKLSNLSEEEWQALALTLEGYAQRDNLKPLAVRTSGSDGSVLFPGTRDIAMLPGLYLVTAEAVVRDGYTYRVSPFIVHLPNSMDGKNTWQYDVTVNPKYERIREEEPLKVLKVWEDQCEEDFRPESISVQLLCDGELYEEVELTKENSWRYSWDALPTGHSWNVTETEVPGYTVQVKKEGITFIITNTHIDTPPPEEKEVPPPEDGGTPPPGGSVPYTGMLLWPIPLLMIGGLLFLTLGIVRRRRAAADEK